jgi:uncharacterized membrane protein YfcA
MSHTAPAGEAVDQVIIDSNASYLKKTAAIGWFLLTSPLLPIGVLFLYAVIAWYQVGHFPYYGHPDPKDMGRDLLHLFVYLFSMIGGGLAVLATIGAVPLLLIVGRARKAPMSYLAISLLASATQIWFITADPMGLWEWIAD